MSEDLETRQRLETMERKLFWFITPWAVLTVLLGIILATLYFDWSATWLQLKTALVVVLIGFHLWCGKLMLDFRGAGNPYSHVWFRWFNEFPLVILIAAVLLVIFKPL